MVQKVINHTLVYWVAALIVLFDQYTKFLVRAYIPLNTSWVPTGWEALEPYARFRYITNTGAAFGMFQDGNLVFTVIAIVVTGIILFYSRSLPEGQWGMRLVLGLQLGGAVGNLIDRLLFGTVTDFVSVGTFAIFNVADASISIGVALLLILMLIEARTPEAVPTTTSRESTAAESSSEAS